MNKTLLNLIKTKLKLIENCKTDSFHTIMIYSESLPSLLVQCIGHIENRVNSYSSTRKIKKYKGIQHRDIDKYDVIYQMGSLSIDNIQEFKKTSNSSIKSWNNSIQNNSSYQNFIDEYKKEVIDILKSSSNKQEFKTAIQYLLSKDHSIIKCKLTELKNYRDDFSHGKINSRRLSIISKQDFYIYFGILLLIDKCIDEIIANT